MIRKSGRSPKWDVSIVIYLAGDPDVVKEQLVAIAHSSAERIRYEVLGIYQQPSTEMDAFLSSIEGAFRVIRAASEETNEAILGRAVTESVADQVIFLAYGVVPMSGWLEGLLTASRQVMGSKVIVGTRLVDSMGLIVQAGMCFDSSGWPVPFGKNQQSAWWHSKASQSNLQAVAPNCVMISRDALAITHISVSALTDSGAFVSYCLEAGCSGVAVVQADDAVVLASPPLSQSSPVVSDTWEAFSREAVTTDLAEREMEVLGNLMESGVLELEKGYERGALAKFLLRYYQAEILQVANSYRLEDIRDLFSTPQRGTVERVTSDLSPLFVIDLDWSNSPAATSILADLEMAHHSMPPGHDQESVRMLFDSDWSELNQNTLELMGIDWHRPFEGLPECFEARFSMLISRFAKTQAVRAEDSQRLIYGASDYRSVVLGQWYVRAFPKACFLLIDRSVESSAESIVTAYPELGDSYAWQLAEWYRERAHILFRRPGLHAMTMDSALLLRDPASICVLLGDLLNLDLRPA